MRALPFARRARPPQRIAVLADNTNKLVIEQGQPAAEDLRKSIASVQRAASNLDAMVSDARPGIQNLSKSTLPEANRLIRDLRELSQSLKGVSERVEQGGIGGTLGPKKLPDYKPRKAAMRLPSRVVAPAGAGAGHWRLLAGRDCWAAEARRPRPC